jgi:hypothetical protein
MTGAITFQIEEDYGVVGFRTKDDFSVKVWSLTESEACWLRGQILQLVNERKLQKQ